MRSSVDSRARGNLLPTTWHTANGGFTLIDLMVVFAIIGVMVSLLLPAIQAGRETSRRVSCQSNLRQIGIAIFSYEDLCGLLPIGSQSQHAKFTGATFGISWWVSIVRFFDESPVAMRFDMTGPHNGWALLHPRNGQLVNEFMNPVMHCPSSSLPVFYNVGSYQVAMPSYVGIAGASSGDGFAESRINTCCLPESRGEISAGGVLIANRHVALRQIEDGTSNTLMVGETSDYIGNRHTMRIDGGFPNGWITGTSADGTPPHYGGDPAPPCWNITTIRYALNTRDYDLDGIDDNRGANNPLVSSHPHCVLALFADGSVRILNDSMDATALKRVATRDDGQSAVLN
jgi:hypothetical protein